MNLLPKETVYTEGFTSFGEIKITSPEQFVPLYLVNFVDVKNKDVNCLNIKVGQMADGYYYPEIVLDKLVKCLKTRNKAEYVKVLSNHLKGMLLNNFTNYEFLLPNGWSPSGSSSYGYLGINISSSYIHRANYDFKVLLGCLVKLVNNFTSYFTSKKYQLTDSVNNISLLPTNLIVVRAKHIPKLRLSVYLKLRGKVSIPYGDIKMLKLNVANLIPNNPMSDLLRTYSAQINPEHLVTEYCNQEQLLSYLVNIDPKKYTAEEVLEKTRRLVNNQAVEEVV